jgi:demethylsterigmatocystin 6-O-methyltransferase
LDSNFRFFCGLVIDFISVNIIAPPIFALPNFLAENKYQDITSSVNTPLQKAFNTDQPAFVWAQTQPELILHFNKFMEAEQRGMRRWFDVFPIEEKSKNLNPDQALFVDVGGNIGHQSVALKARLPEIQNDIIVEDLEIVLASAIPCEGVKTIAFDFFQPQVVKGKRTQISCHEAFCEIPNLDTNQK